MILKSHKTDLSPFAKTLQWLPISSEIKAKCLQWLAKPYMTRPHHLSDLLPKTFQDMERGGNGS